MLLRLVTQLSCSILLKDPWNVFWLSGETNFWMWCLPGVSQSGQNGYLWIATVHLAIDFYLETGWGLPRQFLGPGTAYTVSSPWKTMQADLGMSSVSVGCHVGWLYCLIRFCVHVCVFCLCLQIDRMVTSRLKTLLKNYEYSFPRNTVKTVNNPPLLFPFQKDIF